MSNFADLFVFLELIFVIILNTSSMVASANRFPAAELLADLPSADSAIIKKYRWLSLPEDKSREHLNVQYYYFLSRSIFRHGIFPLAFVFLKNTTALKMARKKYHREGKIGEIIILAEK